MHSDGRWPVDGFSLNDDREAAASHQAAHRAGRAFTFLLLNPMRSAAVGCLCLNPLHEYLERVGADPETRSAFPVASAMVTFWIRQDLQTTGLADLVAEAVNAWLVEAWPLDTHLFRILPGELSSRAALERLDVRRVDLSLPGEHRPYLWFQP